jgi:hypothetical protein
MSLTAERGQSARLRQHYLCYHHALLSQGFRPVGKIYTFCSLRVYRALLHLTFDR